MKRAHFVALAFVSLVALPAFAAEAAPAGKPGPADKPSAAAAAAESSEPVIAVRELHFDVSEVERHMPLMAADPKLLEMRYVATFRVELLNTGLGTFLQWRHSGSRSALRERLKDPSVLVYRLASLGAPPFPSRPGAPPPSRPGVRPEAPKKTDTEADVWKALADQVPPDRLPAGDVVAALSTGAGCYVVRNNSRASVLERIEQDSSRMNRSLSANRIEFQVFAPTAERAKELVQGMLSLYDSAIFRPSEQEFLREKEAYEEQLTDERAALVKAQENLQGLRSQLEKFKDVEEISKETLGGLITQQRMIAVDVEGVKARIETCNKLLEKNRVETPREAKKYEQVETLKTAAEIELAGLEARRNSIKQIVDRTKQRNELLGQIGAADGVRRGRNSEIQKMEGDISFNERVLERFRFFPLDDGRVEIRRIKWEPVKEAEYPAP